MSRKSIAQIFSTEQTFVPTKVAVHLRSSSLADPAFIVSNVDNIVVDATNFRSYKHGQNLFLMIVDNEEGGISLRAISETNLQQPDNLSPNVSFPIQTTDSGKHYLYVRVDGQGEFSAYIDDSLVKTVSYSNAGWSWVEIDYIIPDDGQHILSFYLNKAGTIIDSFILSRTPNSPTGTDVPTYSTSPYVTIHGRLAQAINNIPVFYYVQSDAINTLDTVVKDGWYNFNTSLLIQDNLVNDFAFVLTVSGASESQYVIWDTADEVTNPIASFDSDSGYWQPDPTTSMSIMVYASLEALDEYNAILTTPDATLQTAQINDFLNGIFNNTDLIDEEYGTNEVELYVGPKLLTLIVDQSGSMSWNDNTGIRFQFANDVVNALQARYPSPITFNLLKFCGTPAFSFAVVLNTSVPSNQPSDIIRQSFIGSAYDFAGFRVLRNDQHFPETPIDGEIVFDGYALAALDTNLNQNSQYYYTVYTYDQYYRFSQGIQLPVKTNIINAPRGIPNFNVTVINGYDVLRAANIIAMWNTDEGSGDYAFDFTDSAQPLFLTEIRWLAEFDCPTGTYGLRFNGASSNGKSNITTDFNFDNSSGSSYSFWLQPFETTGEHVIICNTDGSKLLWSICLDTNNQIVYQIEDKQFTGGVALATNIWSEVFISNNAGSCQIYINGQPVTTIANTVSYSAVNSLNTYISLGIDPTGTYYPYFGKLSHIRLHDVARDASYVANDAVPNTRFSIIYGYKLAPDNGDRLAIANFEVPTDYNYDLIRVVRNHVRAPYFESDGDIVIETTPTVGINIYEMPADYDVDTDYWFRLFTRNSLGNWSPIEDSTLQEVHIQDQDRPHIAVPYGKGQVAEVNPGPDYGSCPMPTIIEAKAGNQKVYIKWALPTDSACTLVKIYYSSTKYPGYDPKGKNITGGTLIFAGPASEGSFVSRNLSNGQAGYYVIVFTDRLGHFSQLEDIPILTPIATADDSGIPLLEALNVAYHIDDYDIVRITWDSPVVINSSANGWFDDTYYFYAAICDIYGNPIGITFPDNVTIVPSLGNVTQTNINDVFDVLSSTDTIQNLPKANFTVGADGIISGTISLMDSALFAEIASLQVNVTAQYNYSSTFNWTFQNSSMTFNNPLDIVIVNRDSVYLQTQDFVNPPCFNPYISGGSDDPENPIYRVNGSFIRRSAPFVARALFTYKGEPLSSGTVSANLYDASGGPCGIATGSVANTSETLLFASNTFQIQVQNIPVIDSNGNPTMAEAIQSYADLSIAVPYLPQAGTLYVRVQSGSFDAIGQMNMWFPSNLRIAVSGTAPLANGADVREQFARAWFIDPNYPSDQSKIQIVPDMSIMQWGLTNGSTAVRNIPFYSTDDVPLTNGIYSYTRSGTARYVFFGPAKSGSGGDYTLTASISINDLSASASTILTIATPGTTGYSNTIPDPTAPRIFCQMDQCINYLWADGQDWVKMLIFRDVTRAIVPDPVNGGTMPAKYAAKFISCSQNNLFPLPINTVATVSAKGYEIIWGSVSEIIDSTTGLKSLDTTSAYNAFDSANITLGINNATTVYFRINAEINGAACTQDNSLSNINCCGYDMTLNVCNGDNIIGNTTGVVVNTKINFAGQPTVIFGGGPIGGDTVARPPCVLAPMEPLSLKLVGIFVNNSIVQQVVVDGISMNQFIYQITYDGMPVPQGVPLNVLLVVNINGQAVTQVGPIDIYTYLGIPKTIYAYDSTEYPVTNITGRYSFASFTMNPIPIDNNIAIGIGVSTNYDGNLAAELSSSSGGN